jgi:hypothetical protein
MAIKKSKDEDDAPEGDTPAPSEGVELPSSDPHVRIVFRDGVHEFIPVEPAE